MNIVYEYYINNMLVSYANMALVDVEEVVFFITTNGRGKRRCKRDKGTKREGKGFSEP